MIVLSSNLLMYVVFGLFLIVLTLALHERMKAGAPALMQMATAVGIIWAGSLIASGMLIQESGSCWLRWPSRKWSLPCG